MIGGMPKGGPVLSSTGFMLGSTSSSAASSSVATGASAKTILDDIGREGGGTIPGMGGIPIGGIGYGGIGIPGIGM